MRSTELLEPTPNVIRKYVKHFDEMNSTDEEALSLLLRAFPENIRLADILLKVVAINTLYRTRIFDNQLLPVAQHIHRLQVDSKILQADKGIVNKIAKMRRYYYSFATKYCSWHRPEAYPICDGFVCRLLTAYKRTYEFASFTQDDLYDYPKFFDILSRFRERFRLTEFNWKQGDKFLWLYEKERERTEVQ